MTRRQCAVHHKVTELISEPVPSPAHRRKEAADQALLGRIRAICGDHPFSGRLGIDVVGESIRVFKWSRKSAISKSLAPLKTVSLSVLRNSPTTSIPNLPLEDSKGLPTSSQRGLWRCFVTACRATPGQRSSLHSTPSARLPSRDGFPLTPLSVHAGLRNAWPTHCR